WAAPSLFAPLGSWLALDSLGALFLGITSLLFLFVSISTVSFLKRENGVTQADPDEGFLFDNIPEAAFTACLLGFLSMMTLVTASQHFGLLWVAIEATTLVSAPLIHYHRHHRSLEATWKYLLVCSVGIAVALLGTYFLAAALPAGTGGVDSLTFSGLAARASQLDTRWLKAAFLLLLVGYGTKMGLAPLHTWLPDAHSEAPSVVSALLSGALLNCAFLAVLRALAVCSAAGVGEFGRQTLIAFGLCSMIVAAGLIIGQKDYKRMLAYSSVEHMGILAIGVGIGGVGDWGALLHAVNHSIAKAALFLLAGNILAAYGSKKIDEVGGVLRRLRATGALWIAGIFAIAGSPPFGVFTSELTVLRAAVDAAAWGVVVVYSLALCAVFAGLIIVLVRMAQGEAVPAVAAVAGAGAAGAAAAGAVPTVAAAAMQVHAAGAMPAVAAASRPMSVTRERLWDVVAPAALLCLSALLGLYIPPFLDHALRSVALLIGG
ncbi:MAG TPA: proton-conducting transporter membrane subunit, partial [Spirochaetia bacterium]